MNAQIYKQLFFSIFTGLLIFIINQQPIQGQQKKPLNFNDILTRLTFASRIDKTDAEINERLVTEIRNRKVDFSLTAEDEKSLKKADGNDLLIKAIKESLVKEVVIESEKVKEQQILYERFIDNYRGTFEQNKIAIEAGKEFIKKYGDDESVKEIVEYLKANIPKLSNYDPPRPTPETYIKFDSSIKAKKWKDLFNAGAEILKREPKFVDVTITLASVGFDNLVKESKRDFLNETLNYAEQSINLLETEKAMKTDIYGIYDYSLKTKEFPDGKANALGYMNFIVAYLKYFYLDQKDEGVSYFQKSLKYKSKAKELINQLDLPSEIKSELVVK